MKLVQLNVWCGIHPNPRIQLSVCGSIFINIDIEKEKVFDKLALLPPFPAPFHLLEITSQKSQNLI